MNTGESQTTNDPAMETERLAIYALQDGALRAQALAFAIERRVFDDIEAAPATPAALSERLGLAPRILPALLSFLCSQRLLERDAQGRYRNTPAASTFLVTTSARYVGGRGLLYGGFYDAIAHLPASLATGAPWTGAGQLDMFAGFDDGQQNWFANGMFANAIHGGRALLKTVDLSQVRRLLDVGGNAGGYAITIARQHPAMEVTIADLPAVRPLAEARIAASGLGDRVRFAEASFFEDALPRGHDGLLLSSILHDWEDAECAAILAHCYAALEPGGRIIVTEPMLADDYSGPDHPAASALMMAVLGGRGRTRQEIGAMLMAAGFADVVQHPLGAQNSTVTARRPGD